MVFSLQTIPNADDIQSQTNPALYPMTYTHPLIEALLSSFQPAIGTDYNKYRNHVYRVFLNCILLDKNKINEDKYAIAAVFHDIGIWTNHTIDYLNPSVEQLQQYLHNTNQQEWIDEISAMILWHHKTSRYRAEHSYTVETFRKADWIDVSLGLLTFGADRKTIRTNRRILPNLGFHLFLVKQISKNFLRHPLNPLPMFRV